MPDFIIQTQNLDFSFGKQKVLDGLSVEVETGAIYGFVGPNGAGKTTTIRTLLGLYPVRESKVFLFGKDIQKERIDILRNIGAMVEIPSLYDHLSARDNLEITRKLLNVGKKRIDEVLNIVDLQKAKNKKVKAYSLGMKQRLGIALALLSNPKLLILDEPTNGLDPIGIKEIRELLQNLNREFGTTVFLSSHILNEVEKLVTHIGVINNGKLAFQGTLSDLYEISINKIIIETDETSRLAEMLERAGKKPEVKSEFSVGISVKDKEETKQLLKSISENGILYYGVRGEQKNLEELFFDLMKKS